MSPFFASVKLTFSRKIHAPKSRVLATIQDLQTLTTLSPYIISAVPQPNASQPNVFEVTERNTFLGMTTSTKYPAVCTIVEGEGADAQVSATGTQLYKRYRVKELSADECEVVAELDLEIFRLLKSYAVSIAEDGHEK
jgi:hypothetical protein